MRFLGVDIGTWESKGVVADEKGRVLARASCPHAMKTPLPGYAEHDAQDAWWGDFRRISRELTNAVGGKIDAVGVSAVAPCLLPVDARLRPLRPAILYGIDVRAAREIEEIEAAFPASQTLLHCGSAVSSQSIAPKLLWLRRHEPDIFKNARWFLTASSYLAAKLTGSCSIDTYTAAACPPLFDVSKGEWCADVGFFCPAEKLPRCRLACDIAGFVTREAALETGLSEGTPVNVGTADAAAEAVSAGVTAPGDMLLMYGSSIFLIRATGEWLRDERLWSGPYLFPGTFCVTAGMSSAGTLTRWYRDNIAPDLGLLADTRGENAYALLAERAKDIPAGSDGLIALPYFSGERTPIRDPYAKGALFGLTLSHTREHIYNALLESVGYGIAQHFDILREMGLSGERVFAVGGGVKNARWTQMVSDIAGVEQLLPEIGDGAAYGDALMAALAVGLYRDPAEMTANARIRGVVKPDPEKTAFYAPYREAYARLYERTKPLERFAECLSAKRPS